MVKLGLAITPYITEEIHIMTNPTLTSTSKIVENAQRKLLSSLSLRLTSQDFGRGT